MGAAQAVGTLRAASADPADQPAPLRASMAVDKPSATGGAASVIKSSDGHYWAEADVNGKRVRFLVDTGASAVVLTIADARRLGYETHDLAFDLPVTTASGQARGAQIQLASISVAGAKIRDVDAIVIDRGLPSSLLGMTYLGRLSRFEATPTSLILRP